MRDTAAALAHIYNLRHRITRLKLEGEDLAKYGPAKAPDKQGIDTYSEQPVVAGAFYCMDPTGRRTGEGEPPDVGALYARICVTCGSSPALGCKGMQ